MSEDKPKNTGRSTRKSVTRSTRGQLDVLPPQPSKRNRYLLLPAMLLIVGLILVLYQPAMNNVVGPAQLDKVYASTQTVSAADIQENIVRHQSEPRTEKENAKLFDPASVKTINALAVTPKIDNKNIIGVIYAPSVDMTIPIMYGLNQEILLSSAGTMKEQQQMGDGNYALIGHNSKNPDALFAPTHRMKPGDIVYITDKQTVYEYKVKDNSVVKPSEIQVIDDVAGETSLTLLSCTDDGTERVLVESELVDQYDYADADKSVLKGLGDL